MKTNETAEREVVRRFADDIRKKVDNDPDFDAEARGVAHRLVDVAEMAVGAILDIRDQGRKAEVQREILIERTRKLTGKLGADSWPT